MTTGEDTKVFTAPVAASTEPAPATPPKVELPEAPGSEAEPVAPAAEPKPTPEPPSLQDQVKDLTERLAKEENQRKSAEGRLKAGPGPDIAAVALELKQLKLEIRHGEIKNLPEEQQKPLLDQLDVETERVTTEASFTAYVTKMAKPLNMRLGVIKLGVDDPRVVNIQTMWRQAKTEDQVDEVVDSVNELVDTVLLERIAERPSATPPAQNTVVPRGGPTQTDQAWLDAYGDEEDTTIPPNPENAAKAKQLMAKGMSPKPR